MMKQHTKSFCMGALITCFAFSLAFNYLFYSGFIPANMKMLVKTDEDRLNNELAGL